MYSLDTARVLLAALQQSRGMRAAAAARTRVKLKRFEWGAVSPVRVPADSLRWAKGGGASLRSLAGGLVSPKGGLVSLKGVRHRSFARRRGAVSLRSKGASPILNTKFCEAAEGGGPLTHSLPPSLAHRTH